VARLRQAAIESAVDTFEAFATLGAQWVNVHIAFTSALFPNEQWREWNRESFAALAERAVPYGLRVMVEHPSRASLGVSDIKAILEADERLGFHLDVGHANVGGDKLEGLLKALGSRMAHIHLSDNRGKSDDHRALGDGFINWPRAIGLIRQTGYDSTITVEVQSSDRDYVLLSAQKLRQWWEESA
jgi:sugar phosphate isomerase/epimerase